MTHPRPIRWDELPLFASDEQIGVVVLGRERAREFPAIAVTLEAKGFPPVDPLLGRRYLPAVRAFFDYAYGLSAVIPSLPDWDRFDASPWNELPALGPTIYFVAAGGFIKIGYSADWAQRVAKLQVASPYRLKVLHVMAGAQSDELRLHKTFHHLRVHGEWFRRGEELTSFIDRQKTISEKPE